MTNFPTKTLLFSPLPLWACIVGWMAVAAAGLRWSIHGEAVPLALATLAAGLLVVIAEGLAVPRGWRCLRRDPEQRNPWRYALLAWGAAHFLAIVGTCLYSMIFH